MKIDVSMLRPNPFRDLKRYPVQADKVESLKQSISDTSFWDNLLIRKDPDGDGYQIAYGHNRLAALKALHIKEIEVVSVRKFSDTEMMQIMARENMAEWSNSSSIEQETVRAAVEGYAAGKIELPKPNKKTGVVHQRYAPNFGVNDHPSSGKDHPYTIDILANFLGWKPYKVDAALGALALTEEGITDEGTFDDLSTKQAQVVAAQTKQVLKQTTTPAKPQGDKKLAGTIAKKLADGFKHTYKEEIGKGKSKVEKELQVVTIHNAKQKTAEWLGKYTKPLKLTVKPDIVKFVSQMVMSLEKMLVNAEREKLDAIVKNKQFLPPNERKGLIKALRAVAERAEKFAVRLED